jgi:hypothetical protein
MDLYSLYNSVQSLQPYRFGMKIKAILGMVFEVDFRLMFVVFGSYGMVRTADYWHKNRCTKGVVQQYRLGMFLEGEFGGTVGVVRYFPWLEMCICCCFVHS